MRRSTEVKRVAPVLVLLLLVGSCARERSRELQAGVQRAHTSLNRAIATGAEATRGDGSSLQESSAQQDVTTAQRGDAIFGSPGSASVEREGEQELRGEGGMCGKPLRAPRVVAGRPDVVGSMDKEVVRRVARRHQNELHHCYEKQLQENPTLAGTVKIKFVIASTGKVMNAAVASSSLDDSAVERCVTEKIRRWTFPSTTDGVVIVRYPFKFSY